MNVNLTDPIFTDEDKAREFFESIRWPNGPVCPHCGNVDASRIYSIAANPKKKVRAGLRECQDCHGQFTVRTGHVMESSHVPLTKWALAYRFMNSSKKGMSAHQLHRSIGVTYRTAWFMWHRIRESMRDASHTPMGGGGGAVEVDETFWGRDKTKKTKRRGRRDRDKIMSLVDRNSGRAKSIVVDDLRVSTLIPILRRNIRSDSRVMTDDAIHYIQLAENFAQHETVRHSDDEWVRGDTHTNTIEGFFSIFKRGMVGVYQHCSEQHLQRYLHEFDFRYSNRAALGIDDAERTRRAVRGGDGKRLTYRPAGGA